MPLPFVPGCEGVGHSDQGDVLVYGAGIGSRRAGTFAEQVLVPQDNLVAIPDGVDAVQAAGVGVAGVTAWGLMNDDLGVSAGDRVLILGASGGVGMLSVQLAARRGARVWSQVSRDDDVCMQRSLGAENVVVSGAATLTSAIRPFAPTVVIDPLAGAFTGAAVQGVAVGARIRLLGTSAGAHGELDFATLYRKQITISGFASLAMSDEQARHALISCLDLMRRGTLRVHVDAVVPLGDINDALASVAGRHVTGKVVVAPRA